MKTFIALVVLLGLGLSARAEEKEGIRLDVTKKTLERNDGRGSYTREIGRLMTLHAVVKNVSFNDWTDAELTWMVVVQRWGLSEKENLEMTQGSEKIPALKKSAMIEFDLGEIEIGGHLHGTSKEHVDKIEGWKIVVTRAGKKTEFVSGSTVERMLKRAQAK